jgi:hypothetical protein
VAQEIGHCGELVVGAEVVELAEGFDDAMRAREGLLCYVFEGPQLHLVVWVESGRFVEEIGLYWRQFSTQPGLVDDGRDEILSLLFVEGRVLLPFVEDQKLLKGNFIGHHSIKQIVDTLRLNPCKSDLHLLHIDLIDLLGSNRNILRNDRPSRYIESVSVAFDDVEFLNVD